MNIYVAASFRARTRARRVAKRLALAGFNCVQGWTRRRKSAMSLELCAYRDLYDLGFAHMLVLLTEEPSTAGGMDFETGFAFASGIPVALIGPRRSAFHHMAEIEHFDTVGDFLQWAQRCGSQRKVNLKSARVKKRK